jgi:hypothetical protein
MTQETDFLGGRSLNHEGALKEQIKFDLLVRARDVYLLDFSFN